MTLRAASFIVLFAIVFGSSDEVHADFIYDQGTQQRSVFGGSSNSGFTQDSSLYSQSTSAPLSGAGGSDFSLSSGVGSSSGYQVNGKDSGSIGFSQHDPTSFTGVTIQLNSASNAADSPANTSNDAISSASYTFTFSVGSSQQVYISALASSSGSDSGNSQSLYISQSSFFIQSVDNQQYYAQLNSEAMSGNTSAGGSLPYNTALFLAPGTYEFYGQVSTQAYDTNSAASSAASLTVTFSIVPEPSSVFLCLVGSAMSCLMHHRTSKLG